MKIGIIGAGFTGLSAAYQLSKKGHEVTVFETEKNPGGLAVGFKKDQWAWSLEKYYHHFFTNDKEVFNLAQEIGHKIIIKRPKTSIFIENSMYHLDSPIKLLTFNKLTLVERLRMAFTLSILRYNPFWQVFEGKRTTSFLPKLMGKKAYEMIWKPQILEKFGSFSDEISLAWFWARIKKRTTKLAYPKGGFLEFANAISRKIEKRKGKMYFESEVLEIKKKENKKISIEVKNKNNNETFSFDKVIVTLPSFLFQKITPSLPNEYKTKLKKLKSIGSINVVLRLKSKLMKDDTYWLSICQPLGVAAVVEHTNFMENSFYNNEFLVYIGKYLPNDDKLFRKTNQEIFRVFSKVIEKIDPNYKKELIEYFVFKSPFSQPIIPVNYSKIKPPFETPIENLYLANIDQVYPWDRGTNYALELGRKISEIILK